VVTALRLANPQQGAVLVFTLATAVFLLPWAVLAVPIASSAFPVLSAASAEADRTTYDDTVLASCRAVLIGTLLAAGVLIGIASPASRVLLAAAPGSADGPAHLAAAIRALAVGLVGYGILAVTSRALFADARARAAGAATVTGWLVVLIADVVLTQLWPGSPRATLLGVGNTVGMTVAGGLLLGCLRVRVGALSRTSSAGLAAALAAAVVGLVAARPLSGDGTAEAVGAVLVAGALAAVAGIAVLMALARDDLRSVVQVLRR
jgi:putative peptidoglycan lipid II flippase